MTCEAEMNLLEIERLTACLKAIFKGRDVLSLDVAELSGIFGIITGIENCIDKALNFPSDEAVIG